jgi:transcriptional regulator with XRE-family HTH domain
MDIRRLFGLNLRRLRLAAGVSQDAIAAKMGIDRAHVSGMERGQKNVTLLTIWAAAQALGCRPSSLLDDEGAAVSSRLPAASKAPRSKRTKL